MSLVREGGEWAKSCARRSEYVCNRRGGGASISCSNDPSVARIQVGGRHVTPGMLDDLRGLPYVAAAGGWSKWTPGL